MSVVLQPWVTVLPWKQQSILLSGLRGPDLSKLPNVKIVGRWIRMQSQHNADPSKSYMAQQDLPDALAVCEELEFLTCHFVHHFADALAVIAYNHPELPVAWYAAGLHYRIAEELFHFTPEAPAVFVLRHRDKPDGIDEQRDEWESLQSRVIQAYADTVQRHHGFGPKAERMPGFGGYFA